MSISLYDATVLGFIQTADAVQGFLEKAHKHCSEHGIALNDIVAAHLYPDMLPFQFQINSVAHYTVGAIEGAKAGAISTPSKDSTLDYAGLQKAVADASGKLKTYSRDEINALDGRDMTFNIPNAKLPFTVDGFLLSFVVPNLHFHATTAYDILRSKGVPVGKRDYLGQWRMKQ